MADGASYIIDVAAQMTGGAQTNAQLDALSAKLVGAGAGADDLHDAIATLSNQLDAAGKASTAAASALSAGNTEYARLQKAADQAAKAVERAALKGAIDPATLKLAAEASTAVNGYVTTLAGLEAEATRTAAAQKTLGSTLANARQIQIKAAEATGITDGQLRKLKGALPALGGAFGSVGGRSSVM